MKMVIALILAAAVQSARASLSGDEQGLVGPWKLHSGISMIDGRFEFRRDGTYSYDAGRGSQWRVAHEGTFSIRASRLNSSDRILLLMPTRITKEPGQGQFALERYRYMDNTPREFKISDARGTWPAPTKAMQDLDRDPQGAMQWWIISDRNRP